jgi:RNA polymerase sigma-70 factor (ECF subfamily)
VSRPLGRTGAWAADIEALFRRRHREFLRVAGAIVASHEGGEDAVQEGLARALAKRCTFRGEGALEAWLWRVIVNAARNARRRARDAGPVPESATPTAADDDGRIRAAVRGAS